MRDESTSFFFIRVIRAILSSNLYYYYLLIFCQISICFRYITVACSALRLILRNFAPVIKSNVEAPLHTIGVDVSREERSVLSLMSGHFHSESCFIENRFPVCSSRYHKCLSCYEKLSAIRAILLKKQSTSGKLGASFRELAVLIRNLE